MDIMSMLMNARVMDEDGDEIGEVVGISIIGGKMMLSTNVDFELDFDYDEDDPDGGEEVDEDDEENEEELDPKKETGDIVPLRVAAVGGRNG